MAHLNTPFVGSEAIANGLLRKHELRGRYRAVFPDVYANEDVDLTMRDRTSAAWLWSHREGVIAGVTASALHGAKWVDDHLPIELIWRNTRSPRGIRVHDMRLREGETSSFGLMRVTTPARTAFDLGRRGRLDDAIARLDALGKATSVSVDDVLAVAANHPGARGSRQLRAALDHYDRGAESPRETWLRLLLIRAGYPRPRTQIPVRSPDGRRWYRLDMGWEGVMVAAEYDGDHHRADQDTFAYGITRDEDLRELGWTVLHVTSRHRRADILRRMERAWLSKLRSDRESA